jgi:hypothetical protein
VHSLIVQDAVAHYTGLSGSWKLRRAFWADRAKHEAELRTNLLSLATSRTRHVGSVPNPERYDPDLDEFRFLNVPAPSRYPARSFLSLLLERHGLSAMAGVDAIDSAAAVRNLWQIRAFLRSAEPESFGRDVPNAETHIIDGGHFALDTAASEIGGLVDRFLSAAS